MRYIFKKIRPTVWTGGFSLSDFQKLIASPDSSTLCSVTFILNLNSIGSKMQDICFLCFEPYNIVCGRLGNEIILALSQNIRFGILLRLCMGAYYLTIYLTRLFEIYRDVGFYMLDSIDQNTPRT